MEKPELYRYVAIIRSSLSEGVYTDVLYDVDINKKQRLANRFLEKPVSLFPEPKLSVLQMRAQYNNATLIAFTSETPMTSDLMDAYIRSMGHEDLQAFLEKHRI